MALDRLQNFDESKLQIFKDAPLDILLSIRNELSNDGLIYVKHVRPIF